MSGGRVIVVLWIVPRDMKETTQGQCMGAGFGGPGHVGYWCWGERDTPTGSCWDLP